MKTIQRAILYILLGLFMIVAAFEAGMLYEIKDSKGVQKQIREIQGELESHKIMLRGIGKGRMPQIP